MYRTGDALIYSLMFDLLIIGVYVRDQVILSYGLGESLLHNEMDLDLEENIKRQISVYYSNKPEWSLTNVVRSENGSDILVTLYTVKGTEKVTGPGEFLTVSTRCSDGYPVVSEGTILACG